MTLSAREVITAWGIRGQLEVTVHPPPIHPCSIGGRAHIVGNPRLHGQELGLLPQSYEISNGSFFFLIEIQLTYNITIVPGAPYNDLIFVYIMK